MRPAYLEPRTDVPAREDWSTGLALAELRMVTTVLGVVAAVSAGAVAALVLFVPATPGTVAAIVLLGLVALFCSLGPVMRPAETAPLRRGLLDGPWRRVAATTAAEEEDVPEDRLIVFDGETVVLRGFLQQPAELVLDRQEVFLCGPDAQGRAVVRMAGMCRMERVRVDARPARPRERLPQVSARPLDDPTVARAARGFRYNGKAWLWPAVGAGLGAVVAALSLWPLSVPGLVVGGLVLVLSALAATCFVPIGRLYREAEVGLHAAQTWTPVPVTLFPWEPHRSVTGLAQLPGGTALVQFPLPELDVIANIADTGTMWIAGGTTGVVAVGLPRLPVLGVAVIQPDRDRPENEPQPWLLRHRDPGLREIPALRR
ncbi:hypothetical protein ABZ816_01590 [Actinosynnema sp. NPDC047251]|uniref:Putative membrane protein n=1 Tax=Saccharothrix espanaensis (strain ATCC 51144 / DSM 44229 / JCM 9112 / NBRC 15066 / NRRL 15764) TaxID=1179773 RepID=K0K244_SACES|nr:hypothetical protein [Saccharothrix espanaensis]CCH30944.1 putative membrane protein [Saccharothrix espanaensis DSM 44229]